MTSGRKSEIMCKVFYEQLGGIRRILGNARDTLVTFEIGMKLGEMQKILEDELVKEVELSKITGSEIHNDD